MTPADYIEKIRAKDELNCCADTGCARKIQRHFERMVDDSERRACELSLIDAFNAAIICMALKGSIESAVVCRIFSICRMLGLRPRYAQISHLYLLWLVTGILSSISFRCKACETSIPTHATQDDETGTVHAMDAHRPSRFPTYHFHIDRH